MQVISDIQGRVADIATKVDAVLAKLATAQADALTPEDKQALQTASDQLGQIQAKLG